MSHMKGAGHVRWGQDDGKRRLGTGGVGGEVTGIDPILVELSLYRTGIPRLGKGIGAAVVSGRHALSLGTRARRPTADLRTRP